MTNWLSEPFHSDLVRNALMAGVVAAVLCAVVGTWVVLRGSVFLGEAMGHGILPGVALASLLGGNLLLGAMVAALAMAYGVSAIGSSVRLSADTSTGLLLVGMLALGVIVVSHSQSYATDLTALLFGDVLAATAGDIVTLVAALAVTLVVVFLGRRAFVAATFDTRKAETLGLRPRLAAAMITVLMAVAIVASFHVVGTLLVLALLVAPPAAAVVWADSISGIMVGAAVIGALSVGVGLVVSWHAETAGGATIAATAVGLFVVSVAVHALRRRSRVGVSGAAIVALVGGLTACSSTEPTPGPPSMAEAKEDQAGKTGNAEELAEPSTRLILVQADTGAVSVYDVIEESETDLGEVGPVDRVLGDGRFGYLSGSGVTVVDSGAWTFDHGDHSHYYATQPTLVGDTDGAAQAVTSDTPSAVLRDTSGQVEVFSRDLLADGEIQTEIGHAAGVRAAVPFDGALVSALDSGALQLRDAEGVTRPLEARCKESTGAASTKRAVFFGCRDGAIRISGDADGPEVTAIAFPPNGPAAAIGALRNSGRDGVLVAFGGDRIWALDSARLAWTDIAAPGVVAAGSAGDGAILALTRDGVLRSFGLASKAQTAELPLFADGISPETPAPALEIDSDRAYVNDAVAGVVYEIDYGAGMRLARTLDPGVRPDLMVETGR